MAKQTIQFDYDADTVWRRISGRRSVFLDTNAWILMADGTDPLACRARDRLKSLVEAKLLFCPVSWGTLEELFLQSGPPLEHMSALMEELSLNACYVNRREVFQWEFARSLARAQGAPFDESLRGLYTTPAAFVGSSALVTLDIPNAQCLSPEQIANAQEDFRKSQANVGIAELARDFAGSHPTGAPPAYAESARKAMEKYRGDRVRIFAAEAENCFRLYITPVLRLFPPQAVQTWLAQFTGPGGDEEWFVRVLAQLPALHNFVDLMVEADRQPARKDSNNHFMDNEIMTVPIAYADAFVAKDRGMRDLLRNRTTILPRTKCTYCDGLEELELWIEATPDLVLR